MQFFLFSSAPSLSHEHIQGVEMEVCRCRQGCTGVIHSQPRACGASRHLLSACKPPELSHRRVAMPSLTQSHPSDLKCSSPLRPHLLVPRRVPVERRSRQVGLSSVGTGDTFLLCAICVGSFDISALHTGERAVLQAASLTKCTDIKVSRSGHTKAQRPLC